LPNKEQKDAQKMTQTFILGLVALSFVTAIIYALTGRKRDRDYDQRSR
jgi:hypothetical protein